MVYRKLTFLPASLSGLGSQATARQGNILGVLGVSSGILASLAAVGFPPEVLAQFVAVAAMGGTIGSVIGRRITATELPQMVRKCTYSPSIAVIYTVLNIGGNATQCGWSRGSFDLNWERSR